ncbi:MAG: alpha-mannosidase 2c1, partial [candidate division Zixibacteria bacterium]|nr:alpha-mannosidase 2c1 [candidate division Zixibacteria bacterium]
LKVGASEITQDVRLAANSRRLDFETTVAWQEKHRMLRVAFPVDVAATEATFDIQYGYVKRPTHRNTSWDMARFEVTAHRYVDLSDNDHGVALLNDCKYGHKVLNNVIDLNLLRSPNYPDPDADQQEHTFTYSLFPHEGPLIGSSVQVEAAALNQELVLFEGMASSRDLMPIRITGTGVSLEVVKKAEAEDCLILRVVETLGRKSTGRLIVDWPDCTLVETDLMEWQDGETRALDGPIDLLLQPFEITTYKLKRRGREE